MEYACGFFQNSNMAKITITVEDLADGGVKIVSDPNFETMLKMDNSGNDLTSAHGYALAMLNRARTVSKEVSPTNLIKIPSIRRV